MPLTEHRTFSLLDAMTLVAATAVGLAGLRCSAGGFTQLGAELSDSVTALAAPPEGWSSWGWALFSIYGLVATVLVPFCAAWTLAILGLRLRRPHPRLRRLACQPGALACYAAAFALVPAAVGLLGLAVLSARNEVELRSWEPIQGLAFVLVPALTGFAVLGSWATLLVGRRWRAEPSWIDRAGRVLGLYWIGAIALPLWGL